MARHLGRVLRHDGLRPPSADRSRCGIPEPSYNTWNIGIGFTYKVFTLDLRYSDTDLTKGNCNAFTSDYSTTNFSPSLRDQDQSGRVRLQLVRRDGYRQAVGRPDGDDQPEVTQIPLIAVRAAERSAALLLWDFNRGRALAAADLLPLHSAGLGSRVLPGRSAKWSPSGASAAAREWKARKVERWPIETTVVFGNLSAIRR